MASQTDVQQLIQGMSSGSNNGNPNTAYNNAPGTPMMDAQGNWFLQNLPTAASLNMGSRGSGGGTPSMPSLPPLTGGGGGGWGFPPPATTPGTTPPPQTTPTVPPGTVVPMPPNGNGVHGGNIQPGDTLFQDSNYLPNPTSGGGRWADGNGTGFNTGGGNNFAGSVFDTSTWGKSGMKASDFLQGATGGVGVSLELMDKLSEIVLPGDIVQNGQINWRQLLDSVGTKLSGGLSSLFKQLLGNSQLVQNYNNWVQGGYAQAPTSAGDPRFGSLEMGNSQGWGFGQVNPITGQLALGLLGDNAFTNAEASKYSSATKTDNSAIMESVFGSQINNPLPQQGYGGLSGFTSNNPFYGSITGEAAKDYVAAPNRARSPRNHFTTYESLY